MRPLRTLFHTCGSCPHPPTQWPPHHRFLRRPSSCQCDSLLHLVARVVTLMGCASSKDEAPSPPRDGGGGGGGGGNSDTVRNSFMSNDSAGSPEILKEVAPHTPLPTHAPPYARPRTHAPPHPRPSLPSRFPPHAPAYPPPRTHAPLRHRGGGKKPGGRPSAGYTCGCTREPCAGGRVAERGWPPMRRKSSRASARRSSSRRARRSSRRLRPRTSATTSLRAR